MKSKDALLFGLLLLAACNKAIIKQQDEPTLVTESKLAEYQQNIEKNALPNVIAELKGVDTKFSTVIDYGAWLEGNKGMCADSLTILSDKYWKAFVTMSMNNPNVYFSRLFLLIMDGELTRTDYVKLFTSWHCDFERESNKKVLQILTGWQKLVMGNSNDWVRSGVSEYDKGNKAAAIECYEMAIKLWPKNPWANYEMGLTMMMDSAKGIFADSRPCDEYYIKARRFDPFQEFAYQGKKEISQMMIVIMQEIEPALKRMATEKVKSSDMKIFADGCKKIREWELAAYAYHFQLHMTLDKTNGFDVRIVQDFTSCLDSLGANGASKEIREQFFEYNRLLKEQNGSKE